jgi:hypothetical protein
MALTRIPATGVNSLQSFTFANVTSNANLNTSNLSANGTVNFTGPNVTLGSVSNLHISGGTSGYVLSTDGSGTLSWVAQTGGGGSYSNSNVASYLPTYTGNITAGNIDVTGNISASYVLGNGSQLTGLPASYSNTNVASYLPTYTGNYAGNNINLTGNSTASYFIGNGSQLTGITGTYSNANVANYLPTYTGNLTAGNVTVNTDLGVTGNTVITGNLTVQGNTTYINVDTFRVEDPIIELGGGVNGAPLSSNDGKDRGSLLHYYTSAPVDAFMGWDISNSEFAFGSNVSVTNDVVTYNSFGNVRANYFIGNGSQLTGVISTTAQTVTTNAQPNITSVGTLSSLNVTGNVTASYFIGNGSALTGITSSQIGDAYSNTNVAAYLPTYTGNIKAGNANILTDLVVSGNITANTNLIFSNSTANFTVGNLIASGNLTTGGTANLQVGNLFTGSGSGGTIAGANLVSANYFTGTLTTAAQPNVTSLGTLSTLNVTGNVTANYYIGNGSALTGISSSQISGAYSNTNVAAYLPTYTGNLLSGNANLGNLAQANFIQGTLTTGAQPNITSVGSLSGLTVTGLITATGTGIKLSNIQDSGGTVALSVSSGNLTVHNNIIAGNSGAGNVTASYFIGNGSQLTGISAGGASISNGTSNVNIPASGGNVTVGIGGTANVVVISTSGITLAANDNVTMSGTLSQLTGANLLSATYLTGTLTTGAQPNITSVGTMQSVTMAAGTSISGGNLLSANFVTGTLTTLAQPNITSVGTLASLNVTGNVSSAANVTAQFFIGNGSQLTGISAGGASISNGTSNVNIPSSGGNVTVSVGGTANVAVFSTDAITLAANADITMSGAGSQLTGANLVSATNLTGTLTTAAQTNITSVGTLTALTVTGNTTSGNYHTAGSITASTLISNVATGTAPLTVTSTTRVNNLNVNYANVSDFNVVTAQTTGTFYPAFINGSTTGNYALGANGSLSFAAATGTLTSTLFTGTLTTGAQPNITSLGTLTTLTASGNISTAANVTANYFIGNGSQLTGISVTSAQISNGTSNVSIPASGGNVLISVGGTANIVTVSTAGITLAANDNVSLSGSLSQVSGANLVSATYLTGTLTTGAQPNITSVGTMQSITMAAATSISGGNLLSANFVTGTLTTAAQPNITSVGTLTALTVTGNTTSGNYHSAGSITASTLISNVATGTAPLTITSTTRVNNLNVNYANVSDFNVVTAQTAGTWYPTLINGATTANYALGANNALLFYPANGRLSATGFIGDGSALTSVAASSFANGTSNLSIPVSSGNVNISAGGTANVLSVGSTGVLVTGDLNSTGWLILESSTEVVGEPGAASGTQSYDVRNGLTFYHSSATANWTANFTNVPTTNSRSIQVTLIVNQGATGYYPNVLQVDGVSQTINWQNNTTPVPSSNNYEIYCFTLLRSAGAWIVLGTYSYF